MSRWFRLYADAMRNPKVARLSDKDFRLWIRLLSVASENDGALPPVDDLKHVLNMRLDHLSTGLDRLITGGLIDALDGGYKPHSWDKFQYKSDTSTARVTKHRAKRNVSETPPDTETEAELPLAKANADKIDSDKQFWDEAKGYLGKSSGGLINGWLREFGKHETANAITAAQLERAVDPVAFIKGRFRHRQRETAEGPLC